MKRKDQVKKIISLSENEIVADIAKTRKELAEKRIKLTMNQLKNHQEIKDLRRKIARMETILHEKREETENGN